MDKDFKPAKSSERLKVDWVILSKDPKVKMNELGSAFDFGKLIFDSSNSEKKVRYWKKDCEKAGIDYHDVNEKGAFVENI